MSRCMTLEEYLERFVDEHTESAAEDTTLLLSDAQAQTLGLFFITGLTGYLESIRNDRCALQIVAALEGHVDGQMRDELDQQEQDQDQEQDEEDLIN